MLEAGQSFAFLSPSPPYVTLQRQLFPDCQAISTKTTKFNYYLQRGIAPRAGEKEDENKGSVVAKAWERPGSCGGGMQKLQAKDYTTAPSPKSLIHLLSSVPPTKPGICISSFPARINLAYSLTEYPLHLYLTCLSSQLNCILTVNDPEQSHYKFLLSLNHRMGWKGP